MKSSQYIARGFGTLFAFIMISIGANVVSSQDQDRDVAIIQAQNSFPIPSHTYMPSPVITHRNSKVQVYFEGEVPYLPTPKPIVQRTKTHIHHGKRKIKTVVHHIARHVSLNAGTQPTRPIPEETEAFFVKGM